MNLKKGMVGLVMVVMVIGYMMVITTSNTMLVQTETTGKISRQGYKKAYYAAVAGLGVAISKLRLDSSAYTFDIVENRPHFVRIAPDPDNHYSEASGTVDFSTHTRLFGPGWLSNNSLFSINTDFDNNQFLFIISMYYSPDPVTGNDTCFIKSQGKYIQNIGGNEFKAQIWGKVPLNIAAELIGQPEFGAMGVQSLNVTAGSEVNDFWDLQTTFK